MIFLALLEALAKRTWEEVAWANSLRGRLSYSEDTISDTVLRTMNLVRPDIPTRSFSRSEEAKNGADLAIWLGSDRAGWIGFRIQAKKLHLVPGRPAGYPGLWRSIGGKKSNDLQIDVLLKSANAEHAFPMHLFYNGWDERWVADLKRTWNPVSDDYGCALAFTEQVAAKTRGTNDDRLESLSELMEPWHWFFRPFSTVMDGLDGPWGPWTRPGALLREAFDRVFMERLLNALIEREGTGAQRVRSFDRPLPPYLQRAFGLEPEAWADAESDTNLNDPGMAGYEYRPDRAILFDIDA